MNINTLLNKKSLPAFFLALLLITLPNFIGCDYNYKRIYEVTFLYFTFLFIFFCKVNISNKFDTNVKYTLIAALCLGIISGLTSENIKYAFIELITFFSLFIATLGISETWKNKDTVIASVFVLITSFLFLEIKFYAYYLAFLFSTNKFSIHEFFPSFANARFFNQYQIWTLPFLTLIFTENVFLKKTFKLALLFIAISWWLLFFTTGSRGAILSVITAICIVKHIFKKKSSDFIRITLYLSLTGFVLYQFLFHAIPYLINQDSKLLLDSLEIRINSSDRLFLWEKAISFSIDNPVLGIGPMHFAWQDINNITPSPHLNHPHNSFLQWAAEWGLISLSLISYLTLYSLKKWFTRFNYKAVTNTDAPLAITLTFSVISALTYSLFSGVIVMPMSQLMGVFIISIMIGTYNNELPIIKHTFSYLNFTLIPIALLYFYLLSPQLIEILFNDEGSTTILTNHTPRFWLDGDIF